MLFNNNITHKLINTTTVIGEKIMQQYGKPATIKIKENNTPVTNADILSHNLLITALKKLKLTNNIISEESDNILFNARVHWQEYWLIDPLDGTKGFINKTDDFCICIAYIKNNTPIFGMIYLPVKKVHYFAYDNIAYKLINNKLIKIKVSGPHNPLRVIIGRHAIKNEKFINHLKTINSNYTLHSLGSAIKICLIAEGKFDYHLNMGICSEWDTAAANYILSSAGGFMLDFKHNKLKYNLKNSMQSPHFFATNKYPYK